MLKMTPLYSHCVFRSQERSETHSLIARELIDHRLHWQGGEVDTRLYKFNAQRLSLYSLRYGDAVSIFPKVYDDFSLVHFSLRGGIEILADGGRQEIRQGRAIISSPRKNIRLNYSNACEQLILRVPHDVLNDAARQLGRPNLDVSLRQIPGLFMSEAACQQWEMYMQMFLALDCYSQYDSSCVPWLENIENGMAMFLLLQSLGVVSQPVGMIEHSCGPVDKSQAKRRLDRLFEYAMSHLTCPVTLADLAEAVAMSERQLNTLCHEHLGSSPILWLRNLRLDAVRDILRENPQSDITSVAILHGFSHLGRFASYYRMRFGELPSQTVRSARIG